MFVWAQAACTIDLLHSATACRLLQANMFACHISCPKAIPMHYSQESMYAHFSPGGVMMHAMLLGRW